MVSYDSFLLKNSVNLVNGFAKRRRFIAQGGRKCLFIVKFTGWAAHSFAKSMPAFIKQNPLITDRTAGNI